LTDHQEREAIRCRDRDRDREPVREIARSYNVSHSTISRLLYNYIQRIFHDP
jgi:IS30 family transposase